jgi:hypothetical protein
MVHPAASRGGVRREGFGAGRGGRGAGRTGGRSMVWQRSEGWHGKEGDDQQGGEEKSVEELRREAEEEDRIRDEEKLKREGKFPGQSSSDASAKWERAADQEARKEAEGKEQGYRKWGKESGDLKENSHEVARNQADGGCDFCGLKNHKSEDCKKRNACELCGLQNHNAYGCKREPLWNFGPELCAAQVPDQSFFFIDEQIDQKVLKERASVAIITVTDGVLNAKQIEQEFRNIISNDTWRWSAKRIAENKCIMRVPSAKMVMKYNRFKLGMKSLNAQITVEPWASTIGAKGMLQQAWFKVRGIPPDQRSLRTIAKVGGFVGKTMAVDENSRFNTEYVRMKIACREVDAIPESAEGCLGMHIYDFFFEREKNEKTRQRGVKRKLKSVQLGTSRALRSRKPHT